ncbi:MAG: hypothetical protein VXZ35_11055, partial [Pseudomonadota bacterium]|nr:hypothetical protein [Pseudomonadota bacterium]
MLSKAPTDEVVVTIDAGDQLNTDKIELRFDASNWDQPQTVIFSAINDAVTEGMHFGRITHTVSSDDLDFDGMDLGFVDVTIADDESPTLLLLKGDGSVQVAEEAITGILGQGVVDADSSGSGFTGSFGIAEVNEVSGNNAIFSAQDLSVARWGLGYNQAIETILGADSSTSIPNITVNAFGNDARDYYSFVVTEDMLTDAGGELSFDAFISEGYESGDDIWWQSKTRLFIQDGAEERELALSDFGNADARMLDLKLTEAGTYIIEVDGRTDAANDLGTGVPQGVDYKLHLVLQGQRIDSFNFTPSTVLEQEGAQALINGLGVDGQLISSADAHGWYTVANGDIGNAGLVSANGDVGSVDHQTPYVSIDGTGDGSKDSYWLTITDDMLSQ